MSYLILGDADQKYPSSELPTPYQLFDRELFGRNKSKVICIRF